MCYHWGFDNNNNINNSKHSKNSSNNNETKMTTNNNININNNNVTLPKDWAGLLPIGQEQDPSFHTSGLPILSLETGVCVPMDLKVFEFVDLFVSNI